MNTILTKNLLQKIAVLEHLIEEQAELIVRLQERIALLEKRTNQNSNNSSKPPSSDGLSKRPRTTSLREKGKNRSGGQLGHKGEILKQMMYPDSIQKYSLAGCPNCKSALYGVRLATATLAAGNQVAFDALVDFEEQVLSMIKGAAVKNLDETGFRVCVKTQWLHVASTPTATYYHVSPKRKSLLEGLTGIVVHDHWKAYYNSVGVEHGLCNKHHLRELKSLIEHEKEAWPLKMSRFLRVALRCRHFYGDKAIPSARIKRITRFYHRIIQDGLAFHETQEPLPCRGKLPKRTGHNLILQDVSRFLNNSAVPFTNNEAECDLRMAKCKQKIAGGFRSIQGANHFARIKGFIAIARKQQWNILKSIQTLFTGNIPLPS